MTNLGRNETTLRAALDPYASYLELFDKVKGYYAEDDGQVRAGNRSEKSLEDEWFTKSTDLCELAFEEQFHYGVVYAWVKLREQEIRNIGWICDMITMGRRVRGQHRAHFQESRRPSVVVTRKNATKLTCACTTAHLSLVT